MGRSSESNFEANVGSTKGSHSIASDSLFDVALGSMNEEQMVSMGSATDGDDMLEAIELNVESANLIGHNLAIVIHTSHTFEYGCDDGDAIDFDEMPLSFSAPQMTLISGIASMSHSVSTSLSWVDREYTCTCFECCVLICRRLWRPYSLCCEGSFSLWSYSSFW